MINKDKWQREDEERKMRHRQAKYSNSPDFVNPDPIVIGTILPHHLGNYIEMYQRTHDVYYLRLVMELLSRLIIRMLNQEVDRHKELRDELMQELYHIAFICLDKAMLKFIPSKSSIHSFPRYLQGYIKAEIRKIITGKKRFICSGIQASILEPDTDNYLPPLRSKDRMILMIKIEAALDSLAKSGNADINDIKLLKMRYENDLSYKEIADQTETTPKAVECRIRRLIGLVKVELKEF